MTKLHEILAAEKTPTGAWNQLLGETHVKFKKPETYMDGHSKSLKMIKDSPENAAIEAQAREEKPVTTTVFDTLEYALGIFARAEDLQAQKNATNRIAVATIMWRGAPLFSDLPVDELLGLEARLGKIRLLFGEIPTLDASKEWVKSPQLNPHAWETKLSTTTTKTEKTIIAVELSPATVQHPAQIDRIGRDVVIGEFTTIHRSGAATAVQKSEAIKRIDEVLVEIKQARMRANETIVEPLEIANVLVDLLLAPLRD